MFVYEKNGAICVTFKSNKPVEDPEYVIVIDQETGSITINGVDVNTDSAETEDSTQEPVEEVVEPEVEETEE